MKKMFITERSIEELIHFLHLLIIILKLWIVQI